jgi:hypothetical protein
MSKPTSMIDDAWDGAIGGFEWLKSVLFGEFADNRSLSALVADMLVSFIPGVVIVTSARDAVAVIIRLAQHPQKRDDTMEWIVLSACMITLALPLAMAAGGAVAAGVGAAVGGIAGSELGAALRAVMLLLIKEATKLGDVIRFLQKFVKGDLVAFLRAIKFAKYERALLLAFDKTIKKLIEICQALRSHLQRLSYFDEAKHAVAKLAEWERKFYAVQTAALKRLPIALAELDARLAKLLSQLAPKEGHNAVAAVKAVPPIKPEIVTQHVKDAVGKPFGPLHAEASGSHGKLPAQSAKPAKPAKSVAGGGHGGGGPEKPPLKDKPDKVERPGEGANTKRQEVLDDSNSAVSKGPFEYKVKTVPSDLVADSRGVYGYVPVEGSQFAPPKWPVDWTDAEQVAGARAVRLEYHQGLADEVEWVARQRSSGVSDDDIARELVDIRNKTRMSKYSEDKLPILFERNTQTYGNPYGPTYESLLAKYGSPQGVIASGTRSNATMDILTGIQG